MFRSCSERFAKLLDYRRRVCLARQKKRLGRFIRTGPAYLGFAIDLGILCRPSQAISQHKFSSYASRPAYPPAASVLISSALSARL
jgi:hypothetical protein